MGAKSCRTSHKTRRAKHNRTKRNQPRSTKQKRRQAHNTRRRRKHKTRGGSRKTNKSCVILFHMDGCGACHSFMPIWKDYVKTHPEQCTKSIELEEIKPIATRLQQPWMNSIRSFPTIVGVSATGERIVEFQGHRTAEALDKFAGSLI